MNLKTLLSFIFAVTLPSTSALANNSDGFHVDPDTQITLLEGFDADLIYDVPASQGSWVAMAFDPKGRLVVSDQDDKGVFRVTLPAETGTNSEPKVESLKGFPYLPIKWGRRTVGGALGFLYAFDSLYMSSMKGLYRIRKMARLSTLSQGTTLGYPKASQACSHQSGAWTHFSRLCPMPWATPWASRHPPVGSAAFRLTERIG